MDCIPGPLMEVDDVLGGRDVNRAMVKQSEFCKRNGRLNCCELEVCESVHILTTRALRSCMFSLSLMHLLVNCNLMIYAIVWIFCCPTGLEIFKLNTPIRIQKCTNLNINKPASATWPIN